MALHPGFFKYGTFFTNNLTMYEVVKYTASGSYPAVKRQVVAHDCYSHSECPTCKGTGVSLRKSCRSCDASGQISLQRTFTEKELEECEVIREATQCTTDTALALVE